MKTTAFAALALLAAFAGQAEARSAGPAPMRVAGTLTCNLDPALGLVVGSVRGANCSYDRYDRRGRVVRETYAGTMSRGGFDVGLTSGQTLSWNVVTSGGRSRPGMLTRAFDGASADMTVIAGPGTHATMSDAGDTISLQPVSMSGQVGVGVGFGAADLLLTRVSGARMAR